LFVVFVSHLARPPEVEAPEFAKVAGTTEYEIGRASCRGRV